MIFVSASLSHPDTLTHTHTPKICHSKCLVSVDIAGFCCLDGSGSILVDMRLKDGRSGLLKAIGSVTSLRTLPSSVQD